MIFTLNLVEQVWPGFNVSQQPEWRSLYSDYARVGTTEES